MNRKQRKGFTLVELMVVVIIVGILASVAIPLYRTNVKKAMATEGSSLLGSVLTSERVYKAENATFSDTNADLSVDATGNKYFTSYTLSDVSATGFTAETSGTGAAADVTVTLVYTDAAGATISYDGL